MIGSENYYAIAHSLERQMGYDECWVIMRSAPKNMPSTLRHVSELAPSWDLFTWFLGHKRGGTWSKELFEKEYVPMYIRGLAYSPKGLAMFQELIRLARLGVNIAVVCTCYEESMCHRAILCGIMQGMCPDIDVHCAGDYSRYWSMMKDM